MCLVRLAPHPSEKSWGGSPISTYVRACDKEVMYACSVNSYQQMTMNYHRTLFSSDYFEQFLSLLETSPYMVIYIRTSISISSQVLSYYQFHAEIFVHKYLWSTNRDLKW